MFKEGDSVILVSFTGMRLCRMTVEKCENDIVVTTKKDGSSLFFNILDGKQMFLGPKQSRYASKIIPDDGSFTEPNKRTRRRTIK